MRAYPENELNWDHLSSGNVLRELFQWKLKTGPDWSNFATRTLNFYSRTAECMGLFINFAELFMCFVFCYLTIKKTWTSKRNQPN